jgi:hypothetical protein
MDQLPVFIVFVGSALFDLGKIVSTPTALEAVPREEISTALSRYAQGDWGELDDDDKIANKRAFETGGRLLSAYKTKSGTKFWIITEADRFVTTILLPEDY